MPNPRWLAAISGLLLPLILTTALPAQELVGRLSASSDSAPVAGALVIMIDSLGKEAGRTLSTPSGGFGLRSSTPGTYRIRVVRIGFAGFTSPPYLLAAGARREVRILVADQVIHLADIEVTTTRSRCGVRPTDGDLIAALLTEAEKALTLTSEAIRQGNLRFRTETFTNRPSSDGAPGERELSTSVGQAMWPVVSAPPESLAVWGFVHEPHRRGDMISELELQGGPVYFGPDARVLFSDWFLDGHCFSVVTGADAGTDVVVEFVPVKRAARRDISGKIVLNRQTLELREVAFRYVGLPRWVPIDSAGGNLSFRKLRSGAWVIDRWLLRAPIPRVSRSAADTSLFGFAEAGGRVTEIRYGRNGEVERLSLGLPDQQESERWRSPGTEAKAGGTQVAMQSRAHLLQPLLTLPGSDPCAHHAESSAELSSCLSSASDKRKDKFER